MRLLNRAKKKGGNWFQLWHIWLAFKILFRLTWRVPYALLCKRGLKVLSRADDVLFINGTWYIEWLRNGFSLHGSKRLVITEIVRKELHMAHRVAKDALRHIFPT